METLEQKILNHYNGNRVRRTFDFGKIAYGRSTRKINPVEVEVDLYTRDNKVVFTASGTIYNSRKTDCYCGGQCLDEIAKYIHNPKFITIHKLWKKYHLNDMHAGTPEQEQLVDDYFKAEHKRYDYDEAKKVLSDNNMLTVKLADGTDYTYGHGWLYEPIHEEDLKTILELLGADEYVK